MQPQWVYDCVNWGLLLPVHEYAPGAKLPPHLSPFVDDDAEGYVPPRKTQLLQLRTDPLRQHQSSDNAAAATPSVDLSEEQKLNDLEEQYQSGTSLSLSLSLLLSQYLLKYVPS